MKPFLHAARFAAFRLLPVDMEAVALSMSPSEVHAAASMIKPLIRVGWALPTI
jgi:hypothetical protein